MTDIQYWFEQYAADAGLVMFEPFVSFGQGMRMLAKLNAISWAKLALEDEILLRHIGSLANMCGITLTNAMAIKRIPFEAWKQD
ncbi:hypothetical protein, partial [Deinococcus sp. GbtcB9]|uniref:hypothetical protein n=1 Tax=Deinococcus sp. GbtcB9 TaxID=2824754 RepID=UPI001C2FC2B0